MTQENLEGLAARRAGVGEALAVAGLLHDFNTEFVTPTPGVDVLRARLDRLLPAGDVVALLVGEPATGLAVLSFRPNVWYDAEIAVLDELYVRPDLRGQGLGSVLLAAVCDVVRERGGEVVELNVDGVDTDARRFYEARGFINTESGETEPMLYYYREL